MRISRNTYSPSLHDNGDFSAGGRVRRYTSSSTGWVFDRTGEIDVICWCDRKVFKVPVRDWLNGETKSCGRPGCRKPEGDK